jgi:hypothetical protein
MHDAIISHESHSLEQLFDNKFDVFISELRDVGGIEQFSSFQ